MFWHVFKIAQSDPLYISPQIQLPLVELQKPPLRHSDAHVKISVVLLSIVFTVNEIIWSILKFWIVDLISIPLFGNIDVLKLHLIISKAI